MHPRVAAPALVLCLMPMAASAAPSKPRILETTPPAYPESSRRVQQHGDVTVRVFITRDGTLASAEVARSSGYEALER